VPAMIRTHSDRLVADPVAIAAAALFGVVALVAVILLAHARSAVNPTDAALGRALRQLAEAGQAPQLLHGPRGWSCQLVCGGRELVFRDSPIEAVRDAETFANGR